MRSHVDTSKMRGKITKILPTFSLEKRLWKKGYKFIIGIDEVGRGALAGPVTAAAVIFASPLKIRNLKLEIRNYAQNFKKILLMGIDDSKRLTSKLRSKLAADIKNCCQSYAIASESAATINRIGIVRATEKAMRKAIGKILRDQDIKILGAKKAFVIVDGRHVKYIPGIGLKYEASAFSPSERKLKPNRSGKRKLSVWDRDFEKFSAEVGQKNIFDGDRKCISIAAASIIAKVHRDELMKKLALKPRYRKYGWEKNKGYGTKGHVKAIEKYGPTRLHRKLFVRKITKN